MGAVRRDFALGSRWISWAIALAVLGLLCWKIPAQTLATALASGPWLALAAFVLVEVALGLAADAFATRAGLLALGIERPYRELLLVRGATYLLGLLSYAVGQGGIAVYLGRSGEGRARAAGAVLFLMMINGLVLVSAMALAELLAPVPLAAAYRPLLLAAAAGVAAYGAVLALRPAWLLRWSALGPLFAAGLRGHLLAAAARAPHVALLALLYWGAFRVWGIAVPLAEGLAWNPLVLLVGALPLTPSGVGTTQAVQIFLFAPFAAGDSAATRDAAVLAFGLAHHALGLLVQAGLGFLCLHRIRRTAA